MSKRFRNTNFPGYVLDTDTNVVINTNKDGLKSYKNQVDAENRNKALEERIDSLSSLVEKLMRNSIV